MSDKVEQWQAAVVQCSVAVHVLKSLPLAELILAGEKAQAVGPLLDPTMWRAKTTALSQDLELLKAAQTFVATVQAGVERAERRGELKVPA